MTMREMNRGELLDRLPDFVHGTLPADERRAVEAALASDPEMRRELEIIRAAHGALASQAAPVNVDGVMSALGRPAPVRQTAFARWRVAAAVATLAVGGASLGLLQQYRATGDEPPTIVGESASVATTEVAATFGYDVSDLSAEDLEQLLQELKQSGGIPSAEPKAATVSLGTEGIQ
jgi:anti-sigma factor RsiW